MNLVERYHREPGNYIVEAGGGYGKSTSLKYLAKDFAGMDGDERKELAIYIPMAEFNFHKVQPGILFDYLKQYFSNEVTEKALLEMIKTSAGEVHYLFLLDGLNEVHNYETKGQTVLDLICNDILDLLTCENVNFIISTRIGEILPKKVRKFFKHLVLQPLSNEAVGKYLGLEDLKSIPGHIRKMLENPMLLGIFKAIYRRMPEQAVKIENKYELFELHFAQDMDIHTHEVYGDHLLTVRRYALEKIIPFLAFQVEKDLLEDTQDKEKDLYPLLKEAYEQNSAPDNVSLELLLEVVLSLGILDQKLRFTHELFRDYFAAKGFKQAGENGAGEEAASFMEGLIHWLEYRNNQKDLPRRTRFLDLADFLFSLVGPGLVGKLRAYGVKPEERVLCLGENFYQHLSGIYEDLSDGREAAQIGWIALDHLKRAEACFSPVTAADKYSFIYYSVKWDRKEDEKCLKVILKAREILDQVDEGQRDREYHILYGKVLSNIGSYYYKRGTESKEQKDQEKAGEMFRQAEGWHRQALEYRKEHCDVSAQAASFKTLMSDAYQMGDFLQGYGYYREAMKALNPGKTLEEALIFRRNLIPEDLVERGMGSEYEILKENPDPELAAEILRELPGQIRYVYEKSAEPNRSNLEMLGSLEKKLDALQRCEEVKRDRDLLKLVREYKKKCGSFH